MGSQTVSGANERRLIGMSLYKRGRSGTWWMVFIYNGIRYRRSTNTMDKKTAQKIHDSVRGRIAE